MSFGRTEHPANENGGFLHERVHGWPDQLLRVEFWNLGGGGQKLLKQRPVLLEKVDVAQHYRAFGANGTSGIRIAPTYSK